MKRIFSKKEKAENEVKVKKRFLNKKIYIAIMLILILLLISILMFARSNGIKNFGDIKNFINNKLNSEEPQKAATFEFKDWSNIDYLPSDYAYGTIYAMEGSKVIGYKSPNEYTDHSSLAYKDALKFQEQRI